MPASLPASSPPAGRAGPRGRLLRIFELLVIDDEIRNMITNKKEANLIKQKAVSKGMTTLQQAGVEKVLAGITTLEEVLRVTQEIS